MLKKWINYARKCEPGSIRYGFKFADGAAWGGLIIIFVTCLHWEELVGFAFASLSSLPATHDLGGAPKAFFDICDGEVAS